MKKKDSVYAAAQENWEENSAVYEKELEKLRTLVNNMSMNLSKIEKLTFTFSGLESKLISSQIKIYDLKRQLLVSSKKLEESASAVASADQLVFGLQINLQASEKKFEGLPTALQYTKIALTGHMAMVKKKTALAEAVMSIDTI